MLSQSPRYLSSLYATLFSTLLTSTIDQAHVYMLAQIQIPSLPSRSVVNYAVLGIKQLSDESSLYDRGVLLFPETSRWSAPDHSGLQPAGRMGHSSVYDPESGLVYVYGGQRWRLGSSRQVDLTDELLVYDPFIHTWSQLTARWDVCGCRCE